MLERTAGCLENAGRRFFQDSNTTIRSRRALYSNLAQNNATSLDSSQRRIASQSPLHRRSSGTTVSSGTAGTARDPRPPVLEFLYPSRTQEYVVSCLLRSSRGVLHRRRKKSSPGVSRTFVSEAASLHRSIEVEKRIDVFPSTKRDKTSARLAKDNLLALLGNGNLDQNDRAWELYGLAGSPHDTASALLARLSTSPKDDDNRRAQQLLRSIPDRLRTRDDYLFLAKSLVTVRKPLELVRVCREAVAKERGALCWAFSLAHFANNSQWLSAKQIWGLGSTLLDPEKEKEMWKILAPQLIGSSLPKALLDLSRLLTEQEDDKSMRDMARFFVNGFVSTQEVIHDTATETILLLFQKLKIAGVLEAQHYFGLIRSLHASRMRSALVRSIVVYRNFRWLMDGEPPSTALLNSFLDRLASFGITAGVQYFLDEYTLFYEKPSVHAYGKAMVAFSRTGDVTNVEHTFKKLVSDHGNPTDLRCLTPLLYVNARVGNVNETERHFRRISAEFGLEQNTICWNILLTAHANADDLAGCFATFKTMVENNVSPSAHSFGVLMGLCANRGDTDTVRQLLSLAKQRQVPITAPLLDTVVEAYCNNQDLDMAEAVAETCLGLDVKGSRVRMWNLLLWNHAFRMDLESISRIRERMDTAKLEPDGMTFAALMLSLVLLRQTDSARRILRTLHRSRRMHATEFHYAIILYGYVRDRNRDMVHIIFREIQARFNRPGLSSRLLVLKSQLQRDLQLLNSRGPDLASANIRLGNAEKFLAETIAEYNPSKLATKEPVPGVGKQHLTTAFPAMYYEYVITAYGKRGALQRVGELFDEYSKSQPSPKSSELTAPLRLVTALMLSYLKADQHKKVEECWEVAFSRAQAVARRPNYEDLLAHQLLSTDAAKPADSAGSVEPVESVEPPQPISLNSNIDPKSLIVTSEISKALEEEYEKSSEEASDAITETPILPAYRFMLSRPLSLYIRSLAYRSKTKKIAQVISEVEKAGFVLTTFNWSTFVQMFASSDKPSEQFEALALFERKFMPNFPGWNNLRRGYGPKPPEVPSTIDVMEKPSRGKHPNVLGKEGRRYWSKLNPDLMQPTYVSMVYLASVVQRARERSIFDGGAELEALHKTAPKTIEALAEMPYLREKFQGVLLRRRQEQGDKKDNQAQKKHFVWTGGVLGVGGRRRVPQAVGSFPEAADHEGADQEDNATETEIQHAQTTKRRDIPTAIELSDEQELPDIGKSIDYQDEHDLEAEALLATQRRLLGTNDELLDNEHREFSIAEYEDEGLQFPGQSTLEDEDFLQELDEKVQEGPEEEHK